MRARRMQAAAGLGLWLLGAAAAHGASLKAVEVRGTPSGTRIILDVDAAVTHRSFRLTKPERVVVDLVGATNAVKGATQTFADGPVARLRVSQFSSAPKPVVRVVADLRTPAKFEVQTQDEDLVVVVGDPTPEDTAAPGRGVAGAVGTAGAADESAAASPAATSQDTPGFVDPGGTSTGDVVPVTSVQTPDAGVVPEEQLTPTPGTPASGVVPETFESSPPVASAPVALPAASSAVATTKVEPVIDVVQTTVGKSTVAPVSAAAVARPQAVRPARDAGHTFFTEDTSPQPPQRDLSSGRRINLDVQGADIHTVLRTLSDYSGKNIIASREVEGQVSARLVDTPWEEALDTILKAHGYGYVEEYGIIRVGVLQKLRSEELEEAAAARKREDLLPIETQVVRMQFADATELKPALADMLSSRGKLQVDSRTNALIISDIPDYVAKITSMAQDLDSRTPQVEIVSKLVDISADDSKNLGIRWDAINLRPGHANVIGSAGVNAPTTGAVGNVRLGTVQSWGQLDAMLDALAKSKRANVVSNPNITTVNNREAKILVGAKIPLIVADQAGNAITQLTTVGIQMKVTPHINSDKTITMDLHPEVSELSSQATVQGGVIIQTSEADTRVLVDNGETAIIGGLVRNVTSETRTGIPVLQDIPVFGALFRNSNKSHDKRELIIFVTPRIIEPNQPRTPEPKG